MEELVYDAYGDRRDALKRWMTILGHEGFFSHAQFRVYGKKV